VSYDASEQRLNAMALAKQPVDNIFANSVIEFIATDRRRVQKCAAVFLLVSRCFLYKRSSVRHQRRVRDALFEREEDVAHADFVALPGLFEDFALQLAESK
jgi:hypothetical protein